MSDPQPILVTGKVWSTMTAESRAEIDQAVGAARTREYQLRADLMTIIDFCDAMAQAIDEAYLDIDPLPAAIEQASDVAHALSGGDGVMGWGSLRWALNRPPEESGGFGPAWPDVRERMADVLARHGQRR